VLTIHGVRAGVASQATSSASPLRRRKVIQIMCSLQADLHNGLLVYGRLELVQRAFEETAGVQVKHARIHT
jgi:hypothetical protein